MSVGERLRTFWAQLGAKLGITLCLAGFVVLFLGWNGAASFDRVPAQFPYLISGGLSGLSLVVIGAAMIIVDNNRRERAELRAAIDELRLTVEGLGGVAANGHRPGTTMLEPEPGQVVAGATSYHLPSCRLVAGRETLPAMWPADAEAEGLSPCRACRPDDEHTGEQWAVRDEPEGGDEGGDEGGRRRARQLRAR